MLKRDDDSIFSAAGRAARVRSAGRPLGWDAPFPADPTGRAEDLIGAHGRFLWAVDRCWVEDPGVQWLGWILLASRPTVRDAAGSPIDPVEADPTLDRCRRFARAWGFGGMRVHFVFPERVDDVAALAPAPIEPHPTLPPGDLISILFGSCASIVAAWGSYPVVAARGVARSATAIAASHGRRLDCLGVLADGEPVAPLFAPASARPVPYLYAEGAGR